MASWHPRPRGAARRDCEWDHLRGAWVPIGERRRHAERIRLDDRRAALQREEQEREKEREQQRRNEEILAAAAAATAAATAAAEDRRIHANRYYAQELSGIDKNTHVYYFDWEGVFQELGREAARPPPKPRKRCIEVTVDKWVYGPNPSLGLEAGESELVTRRVKRWVSE